MPIDELQRAVATIALRTAARHGFALAGGNALIAHGIMDRPTDDVDLFSDQETAVAAAAEAVEGALRAAGFEAERRDQAGGLEDIFYGMGEGLAEWIITAPGGQQTMLQMAYFDRTRGPGDHGRRARPGPGGSGRVEGLRAPSRVEPRDYMDVAACLGRYTVDELISLARRLDPGLDSRDFADVGRQPGRAARRDIHAVRA